MFGYLSEPKTRLVALKDGMLKNPTLWTDKTVTVEMVEQILTAIEAGDKAVEDARKLQVQKSGEAKNIGADASTLADKIENLANGFHTGNELKLLEYDIKPRKAKASKGVPDVALHPILEDDADGEGFVVSTNADTKADYYEWMKGTGANVADINIIPELKMFKTTKKTYFNDDEVPKGVRVFYKVRACNANGAGPWSEAVSRVQ